MADVIQREQKEHYLAAFDDVRRVQAPDWLQAFRDDAVRKFGELQFPHRKQEAWKFTNVNPIVRTPFQSLVAPHDHGLTRDDLTRFVYGEDEWCELVIVDGFVDANLSKLPSGHPVHVSGMQAALESDGELLRAHLGQGLNGAGGIFGALNSALFRDGAVVRIPKGVAAEAPVHIVHVTTNREEATAAHPRLLFVAEAQSEATIVETHVQLDASTTHFNNHVAEYHLADGAHVRRIKIIDESETGYHLAAARVQQQRDSQFTSFTFCLSGKIVRNELGSRLLGEGAHSAFNGLYLLDNDQLVDNATSVEHVAPNCTSWIGYKGVLDGKSHGVFSGGVYVHREAQKTDSNQLNQNMLRSDRATVDTKPLLEIFADDVKCTHGATVGAPPDEQIFYFQTRGMHPDMARAILTYGFADEVVQDVPVEPIRARLDRYVFERYRPK